MSVHRVELVGHANGDEVRILAACVCCDWCPRKHIHTGPLGEARYAARQADWHDPIHWQQLAAERGVSAPEIYSDLRARVDVCPGCVPRLRGCAAARSVIDIAPAAWRTPRSSTCSST